ncbi:hypothetical protein JDS67_12710 [Bacillus cereus]|uniref:hypothetical protein n=1 Tax=Bacillus cereus group TaxID=86661 RepID=UPI000BFA35E9|nr:MULTISPECIES: hypothetical protein [Bacillus cereus group]MBJ8125274.1 hypothetical protein [Bacillus cereus]PFE92714.1 hypothetical protein CN325_22670 [Bacillus thuringiensis]
MKEFIPNIITGVCTLIGALGGVYGTQRGNKKVLKQQIMRDEKKENRKELIETLEAYNKILKADGENVVVDEKTNAFGEFNLSVYQKEIRPILYEKYHLLHDEVAWKVANMDEVIKVVNLMEEFERIDHVSLCADYKSIISIIKKKIYEFRKTGSKGEKFPERR